MVCDKKPSRFARCCAKAMTLCRAATQIFIKLVGPVKLRTQTHICINVAQPPAHLRMHMFVCDVIIIVPHIVAPSRSAVYYQFTSAAGISCNEGRRVCESILQTHRHNIALPGLHWCRARTSSDDRPNVNIYK